MMIITMIGSSLLVSARFCFWLRFAIASAHRMALGRGRFYIPQRGVQWKQGVVVCMVLCTSLLYNTTPIHCTPDPLHPPLQSIQREGEMSCRCSCPGCLIIIIVLLLLLLLSYIYIYIYIVTHLCIYIYIYTYTHVYVCICMYIYV